MLRRTLFILAALSSSAALLAFAQPTTAPSPSSDNPKYVGETITDKAPYLWRDGARLRFFKGKYWLLGGWTNGPRKDWDGAPWIELGTTVTTATIEGHTVFVLTFTPSGDEIKRRFTALNQAPGADPTQAKLTAIGELSGTLNGQIFTSKPFPVTIRQDVDR